MTETEIRARIRRLHAAGEVPCDEPAQTWGGHGLGKYCAACSEAITPQETEYEVELSSGTLIRLHLRCYHLWMEECGPSRPNSSTS